MGKTSLLILGAVGLATAAIAAIPELPENFNPWNLNHKLPAEQIEQSSANVLSAINARPHKLRDRFKAAEQKDYFLAAQKYHEGYTFNYNGGDIITYNIGVSVDGDQVTFSNLFNLAAQSTDWSIGVDYDVVGTYDAAAKTITIALSDSQDEAVIAGTVGDYYTEVLMAGEVTEGGQLVPTDKLVFNVIGNFEAITTDQSFGILNFWTSSWSNYGAQALYRRFYAVLPSEEPFLLSFNENFEMGETFPGTPIVKPFKFVNMSSVDVDFAVECDSDGDSYSTDPELGTVEAQSVQEINVIFNPSETGEYEGMIYVDYEGENEVLAFYYATAVPMPDYSPVVKSGDFTFNTSIAYPFVITSLEDGTTIARSSTDGQYGTSSLTVEFDVPEGNIGTFSWKGESVNTGQWYQNAGGYFIDDAPSAAASWTDLQADITGSLEFTPGHHSVRFQYDGLYYTGDAKNGLYVYDLELNNVVADAKAVKIETPEINLGNYMVKDERGIEAFGNLVIRNYGTDALTVSNATSSDSNFTVDVPNTTAALLETITIPVTLRATSGAEYNTTITIETSAGTVTAQVSALVREMADFTSVVTEGLEYVTSFNVNESYPFEVENGVAYNANSGEEDLVYSDSWFQISFTIPEGKAGYITWDGVAYYDYPDPENDPYNYDYAGIEYSHPMNSGGRYLYPYYGNADDASSNCFANDEFWAPYLTCIPGDHYFRFHYIKNGNGHISEKDRLEISNFRISVEDFPEHACKPDRDEIIFEEPIYVGDYRYLTTTVDLKNTGSEILEVYDVEADHPFYGVLPSWKQANFNQTIQCGVWFYPSEEGEFEGTIVFKTNAGDVPIHCYGSTKEAAGILLIGDIENEGDGWSGYDRDGDGDGWNLGYNLWGYAPQWCHGGEECFGSPSYSPYTGAVEPDNWLFSPDVEIPEDGAVLQWFAASHHHDRYAEHYSVYITIPEMVENPAYLDELEPVFSETLEPESADEWVEHVIDLDEYAGETIVIAFRHHDCNGQYVLKLDDIFVFTRDRWDIETGVEKVEGAAELVKTEVFDLNGIRTRGLQKGINIVRRTYSDGSVKSSKIIVNE